MRNQNDICILVNDSQLSQTSDHDIAFLTVFLNILNRTQFFKFYITVIFSLQRIFRRNISGSTTHMECTQRQLSTRFTDRLSRYSADSLSHLHQFTGCQITAVTFGTYPFLSLTSQHRADLYTFNRGIFYHSGYFLRNFFSRLHQ